MACEWSAIHELTGGNTLGLEVEVSQRPFGNETQKKNPEKISLRGKYEVTICRTVTSEAITTM